jgi:hypothetical protein
VSDLSQVADRQLRAQPLQLLGALVTGTHERAHRNPVRQQQFGDPPSGRALHPARRAGHQHKSFHKLY